MIPILSSLALAGLLAGAPCELPCRCISPPSPAEARDESKAVFVGRVVSQRDSVWILRDAGTTHGWAVQETESTIVVDVSWKLPAGVSDTIRVWTGKSSCDPVLIVGEYHLVYAGENRLLPGVLVSPGCSRTTLAASLSAEQQFAGLGTPVTGTLRPGGYPRPAPAETTGSLPDTHPNH
ncbi:hypothetical protein [Longimicrobium terrae]|uniref:Uncharacterized protein n=1 Tax=Longimicrobium terrae TaxID=1639882 RepID=A0A841H3I4_9BACT|nr:hypothetical protein [Longimicrobium terrae]MBB4638335.1 hypothetical protein [Longimicrobium terrae]MBB6072597.1 hypothetical protein [Longimicrobium terrae]NNC28624.1 hypothetical protein [Longimicrobium terrae]